MAIFGRRHYLWLAEVMRGQTTDTIEELADALVTDNPNFDKDQFIRNCNLSLKETRHDRSQDQRR